MPVPLYCTALILLAGICVHSAIQHAFAERRWPQRRTHLLFSASAILAMLQALTNVAVFRSAAESEHIAILRLNLGVTLSEIAVLTWFFADYAEVRPRWVLGGLTAAFAGLFAFNLMSPNTLQYSEIHGIGFLSMPWGERLAKAQGTPGIGFLCAFAYILLCMAFALGALVIRHRRSRERTVQMMVFAVILFLACLIQGALARQGAVKFVPIGSFGILGMILIMGETLNCERMRERERAASQLRLHSAALESATEAVVITDSKGDILWVNPAFTTHTGYLAAEVMGKNPRFLKSGKHDAAFFREMWQTIRGNRIWCGELVSRCKDGSLRTHYSSITPIRDKRGEITHFVEVKHDVTERKRAEEELAQYRNHLEDLVMERTAELQSARVAADAANQAKSSFLANMSHELRTPLNGILGTADLLATTPLTQEQGHWLAILKASGRTLLDIINDILDLSKIEAGKMMLEPAPFHLAAQIEAVLRPLSLKAAEKGLELRLSIAPETPATVLGDALRVRQILTNLVGNALKFTDRGFVSVTVRPEPGENPGSPAGLHFAVQDTGIGIAPATMDKLFRPFAQADASTVRRFGGTGLGLSISLDLARKMGGRIVAESAPGLGSTFHVILPLPASEDREPADASAAHARPPANPGPAANPKRILLAEDNPVNQMVVVAMLKSHGHSVDTASDGAQALQKIVAGAYDLVLMDVQMPVMDGLETIRRLRQREKESNLPRQQVVAMTANAMAGDRTACLDAGMDGFLAKPFRPEDLYALMGG